MPREPKKQWAVSDVWKIEVRRIAEEKWGWGWQKALSELAGCTQPAISGLLAIKPGAPQSSELVPAIHKALDLPPPEEAVILDPEIAALRAKARSVTPDQARALNEMIEAMRPDLGKKKV